MERKEKAVVRKIYKRLYSAEKRGVGVFLSQYEVRCFNKTWDGNPDDFGRNDEQTNCPEGSQ